jgi:hypothetical protein
MVTWKDVQGTAPVDHSDDAGRRVTLGPVSVASVPTSHPLPRLRTPSNRCGVGVTGAQSG